MSHLRESSCQILVNLLPVRPAVPRELARTIRVSGAPVGAIQLSFRFSRGSLRAVDYWCLAVSRHCRTNLCPWSRLVGVVRREWNEAEATLMIIGLTG